MPDLGRYACSFPGCERHPSKGDDIIRISAKFVGRCREHLGADVPPDLARAMEQAKTVGADRQHTPRGQSVS